ncbi:RNA methyltransferase [Sulfurifustis variabilis]|uniref:RNA methyltransferase n=1 Tax=Sulfurifustis variabilis TaxID=1675686 RepID=A0A1B4VEN5_9GAMM|nr:class I SAM-dependent methyltransferase [Sulfurifustis variabilis]BAU49147.1 RNA methyltransferase [Sulfurifustis variabilis]
MTAARWVRLLVLALALGAVGVGAQAEQAQTSAPAYEPAVGQEGKDVVWVPTPQPLVDKMLDMAEVTPNDYVIDLGSGDGRTVITAAKRGARALGIEYNPDMVALARKNAEREGVAGEAEFVKADLFESDFSRATVITMFLLPDINARLMDKILSLKPGTRIVSNTFPMGDWEPDATARLDSSDGCTGTYCTALLWIVPARVAGTHRVPQGELSLRQPYQKLSGTLRSEGQIVPVEGKVLGERIFLTASGRELHGKMNGKALELN